MVGIRLKVGAKVHSVLGIHALFILQTAEATIEFLLDFLCRFALLGWGAIICFADPASDGFLLGLGRRPARCRAWFDATGRSFRDLARFNFCLKLFRTITDFAKLALDGVIRSALFRNS